MMKAFFCFLYRGIMTHRYTLLVLLLLTSFFSSLSAQTMQYDQQMIEKLEIIIEQASESTACDVKSVLARIKTKANDRFSQQDFDNDLKVLARDYNRVEPELRSIDGKIHIVLKVWPKPTIVNIVWNGNERLCTNDLQKELGIKRGSAFDRLAFNKAFHKLKNYYIKNGFFEAELNYETIVDPLTNDVEITINICEGRAGHINSIIFEGFTPQEECEILDLLVTKEYNCLFSWYTNEGIYHDEAIQQDQFVILNFLQNEGYADAKVKINVVEAKVNRINIHICADKGELYTVDCITFSGNTIFEDDQVRRQFALREGSPYSPDKVRETVLNITDLYGRRGYIDANVDFEPSLDIDSLTYSLKLTIEEGEQYRVGMIKVFGNCTTQTKVILHESLLIPGEVFNIDRLKKTEQKLKNVGYFETVNVYAVKSEGILGLGHCYRDVHIEVKETSTGNFGAFAGFSTSESLFGGLNLTERNFNYKGISRVWSDGLQALRGGGEYAHITFQVGLRSRKYIFSWAKPFFMDTPWTVGFDIEHSNNRYISEDYSITSDAFITHATYRVNDFVRFGWHYRIKNSDVDVDRKEKDQEPSLEKDSHIDGLISATGIAWTYDSTDHPVLPRSGVKSRAEIEYAGIGGDHNYFAIAYTNACYRPMGKKSVIKLRADFRFLLPFGGTSPTTIPLDERLFLGGDVLVRGYRSYRLGPLYDKFRLVPVDPLNPDGPKVRVKDGKSDDPRGGISMQFYSAEFAHKFHEKFEGFVFADAGFLSLHRMSIGKPYIAFGFGTRFKIIEAIPSLTIGLGFPMNPKESTQVKNFFISVGGKF